MCLLLLIGAGCLAAAAWIMRPRPERTERRDEREVLTVERKLDEEPSWNWPVASRVIRNPAVDREIYFDFRAERFTEERP